MCCVIMNYQAPKSISKKMSLGGMIVALGVVFGDIGTSPLYVMRAISGVNPDGSPDYIIGAVSCIIWTLVLQTTVKYVCIALRADNKGEGGILALYALLRKLKPHWLYLVAAIGASALIADGVITPAVTVTSAIEGLQTFYPQSPTILITILIIVAIFTIQQLGTSKIGRCFGPFMLVWFVMLGLTGFSAITGYPTILEAFNPVNAINLLVSYPDWFLVLGAVFLCTTGAEALYSDLGHCGRYNITISWCLVKCALILNYLGQGAWLIQHPGMADGKVNPFYAMMSEAFVPFGIVMATGAAIIASQALISGTFTIFSEAINLDFWPRLHIKYPTQTKGQLYIPSINLLMLAGCVATVLMFGTSSAMEAAYGLAITVTMLMTTTLLTVYLWHKKMPKYLVMLFTLVFVTIEGSFFVANMFKFVHGGWYAILLATLLCGVMIVWYRATLIRKHYVSYIPIASHLDILSDIHSDPYIPLYANNLVYLSDSDNADIIEDKILYSIINKRPKRVDRYWLLRIEYVDAPDTLTYDAHDIGGIVWSIGMQIGFRVQPRVTAYFRQIVEDLTQKGVVDITSSYPSLRSHNIPGDFRFCIIRRKFSPSSSCKSGQRLLMIMYERLRKIATPIENIMGLDTCTVDIETIPLIIDNCSARRITEARRHVR